MMGLALNSCPLTVRLRVGLLPGALLLLAKSQEQWEEGSPGWREAPDLSAFLAPHAELGTAPYQAW